MKAIKYIGTVTLLLFAMSFTASVKGQGIEFFHGTFEEAQAKASKEGKLIFMDAYTSWCGPCKWMAANTFTDKAVGEYYNKNFVNIKVDMEKGEGRTLQRTFKVSAFPTLLFIAPKEGEKAAEVKQRTMGAKQPADFLKLGKSAAGKSSL